MKANNLTISIPADCNRNCPFCISKMTFSPKPNIDLFIRNLPIALKMAEMSQISGVLLTSKGEPLFNRRLTYDVLDLFCYFPTELQTNGLFLDDARIKELSELELNVIAISIWQNDSFNWLRKIIPTINNYGRIVRLTIVVTDKLQASLSEIIRFCKLYEVRQLTFRNCTIPKKIRATKESKETAAWIIKHTISDHPVLGELLTAIKLEGLPIRTLPFDGGTVKVYDLDGIGVTQIDYCIQEEHAEDDMRSLIYHQDGHMYTSWDKPGSILF